MNIKRAQAFFKQNDFPRLIGAVMLIAGLIWFWVGRSMLSYYIPIVIVPIGLFLFIFFSARSIPESEIHSAIVKAWEGLGDDVRNRNDYSTLTRNMPEPFRAEGPFYLEEATCFRRGKNATVISNIYAATDLFFTAYALIIRSRKICLTTGETADTALEISWEDRPRAVLTPFSGKVILSNSRKSSAPVHGMMLELYGKDDVLLFRAPIHDDIDAEALCTNICNMAEQAV